MTTSLIRRLFTALRGGMHEAGTAIEETQQLRILDQEIRDAKKGVDDATSALTTIMAKERIAKQRVDELNVKIGENEKHAVACLEKGDEPLALQVAERIADLTKQRDDEQALATEFGNQVAQIKQQIQDAKKTVESMSRQVDLVRARDTVQKAQVAVSTAGGDANKGLSTAASTLARIQTRQKETAAKLEAANELASADSGEDLDRKLRDANIIQGAPGAQDVLARLRANANAGAAAKPDASN